MGMIMAMKTCCHDLPILQAPAEPREWRGTGLGDTERTRLLPARSQGHTGLVHRPRRGAPCWWILVLNGNIRQFQWTWKMLTLELSSWGVLWTIVPTPIRFLEIHAFAFTAFSTLAKTFQQKEGKRTLFTKSDHCHNHFVIGSSTDIPEDAQLWCPGVRGPGEAPGLHAFTSYKASFQLQHKSMICLLMGMFLGPQLQTQELGFIMGL